MKELKTDSILEEMEILEEKIFNLNLPNINKVINGLNIIKEIIILNKEIDTINIKKLLDEINEIIDNDLIGSLNMDTQIGINLGISLIKKYK
ncbi:MAG: hypothetical protein RSB77_01740 [Bacilli bacterium]